MELRTVSGFYVSVHNYSDHLCQMLQKKEYRRTSVYPSGVLIGKLLVLYVSDKVIYH